MPRSKNALFVQANRAFHLYDASQDVRSLKPPRLRAALKEALIKSRMHDRAI